MLSRPHPVRLQPRRKCLRSCETLIWSRCLSEKFRDHRQSVFATSGPLCVERTPRNSWRFYGDKTPVISRKSCTKPPPRQAPPPLEFAIVGKQTRPTARYGFMMPRLHLRLGFFGYLTFTFDGMCHEHLSIFCPICFLAGLS